MFERIGAQNAERAFPMLLKRSSQTSDNREPFRIQMLFWGTKVSDHLQQKLDPRMEYIFCPQKIGRLHFHPVLTV